MKLLSGLKVRGYQCIEAATLSGLGSMNVLIGPNNSGKTTILQAISRLARQQAVGGSFGTCECDAIQSAWQKLNPSRLPQIHRSSLGSLGQDDILGRNAASASDVSIAYQFDQSFLGQVPEYSRQPMTDIRDLLLGSTHGRVMEEHHVRWARHLSDRDYGLDGIEFNGREGELRNAHLTFGLMYPVMQALGRRKVVWVAAGRGSVYGEKSIPDYIRGLDLDAEQLQELCGVLKSIVDPRIRSYKATSSRVVFDGEFIDAIDRQGSGVRSMVCMAADMLGAPEGSMILVDEPEIGLNSASKRVFLSFLWERAKSCQVFVATHDSAFVNPNFWRLRTEAQLDGTQVYMYSPLGLSRGDGGGSVFVKVNSEEIAKSAESFGGCLPHPETLRLRHVYVEGKHDVWAVRQSIQGMRPGDWELMESVGVYHLGGSFWRHLLYTIPGPPIESLVLLDADKREEAEEVVGLAKKKWAIGPSVELCQAVDDVRRTIGRGKIPILCLKSGCVEEEASAAERQEILRAYLRFPEPRSARSGAK